MPLSFWEKPEIITAVVESIAENEKNSEENILKYIFEGGVNMFFLEIRTLETGPEAKILTR